MRNLADFLSTGNALNSAVTERPLELYVTPDRNSVSWPFRWGQRLGQFGAALFGGISLTLVLAIVANIPVVQILSFGYFLEMMGRLARRQPLKQSLVGFEKASRLGAVLISSWLLLLPIRWLTAIWQDAWLIDPTSSNQAGLRVAAWILTILVLTHLFAATVCGAKLRYYFWPLVAPLSFGIWLTRRLAHQPAFQWILRGLTDWWAPGLAADLGRAQPVANFFLPAIAWRKIRNGTLVPEARDGLWDYMASLRLPYYARLGLVGFVGSLLWLAIPTALMIFGSADNHPLNALAAVTGALLAVPVFSLLPFLQAHFARDGKARRFLEIREVFRNVGRAPWSHWLALFVTLLFALPLFLLKVEQIPSELWWLLSILFVALSWPAKWVTGWAYRQGQNRKRVRRWWIRYPVWILLLATSFTFVFVMVFTPYIAWNGSWSLIENHVFLLPAPFWLTR